ncbi:cutinase [Rhizoctonia solani]|uniref:Cutinase n=2 Tax=Rhizoctonia solani TaxID=456999 RepID=A0A8H8P6L7_9AGAM|nr:cutinase [Rhizoctonia solani]QRW25515.1 cutinase [Rhizoctonia solani]
MISKHLAVTALFFGVVLGAPAQTRHSCSNVQLVHAAGTTENGLGLVGAPLAKALASAIPGTTSYAIPYNTGPEYFETVEEGARKTEAYLAEQSTLCPNQHFVLSGYSKGAMVMHKTNLPDGIKSKILTVLVFGDPYRKIGRANTWPINSPSVNSSPREGSTSTQNVASFCNKGDEFCDPAGASLGPHLAYRDDGSAPADLTSRQSSDCSAVQLVHAAGTGEVGLGIVGTPLASALASAIPGTTSYSVPYSTIAEYVVTVQAGASTTANYLSTQSSRCPSQKFILSGYSKGAMVVHGTELDDSVKSKIISVLVFGDPLRSIQIATWPIDSPSVNLTPKDGKAGTQNVASFCNDGDMFCDPPGTLIPHLMYPMDGSIEAAAKFAKANA